MSTSSRRSPPRKGAARKPAARKPAARKPAARKPAARKRPTAAQQATRERRRGRALVFGLVVLLGLLATMAIGPLQGYIAAADRVDALNAERDQLRQQVDRLEDRRELLKDPEEVELLARTELGMVKPGEVPFTVVSPGEDDQQVRPEPADAPSGDGDPWYRRAARALTHLFDG
jgi:cell division protein FtsB